MTRRTEQINSLLREEISAIISREIKDPRVSAMVSVTDVDTSPDLSRALVYVSLLGSPDEAEESFSVISAAGSFIRHELRGRLSLHRIPTLAFKRDESIERGARLSRLIDEASPPPAE